MFMLGKSLRSVVVVEYGKGVYLVYFGVDWSIYGADAQNRLAQCRKVKAEVKLGKLELVGMDEKRVAGVGRVGRV